MAPLGWGLIGWELGSLAYNSGFVTYTNPYYVAPLNVGGGVIIDYSQPLDAVVYVDPATPEETNPPDAPVVVNEGLQYMDAARVAFRNGDYPLALQDVNAAIAQMPRDASMHEFRALVLFALGQYRDAAAALNAVLAVGPGWDWTTMSGLYPSVNVYAAQRKALETYIGQSPQAADARFVLAYHYLTAGFTDAAAGQLKEVVRLSPQDVVAAQLLQSLSPPQQATASNDTATAPPTEPGPVSKGAEQPPTGTIDRSSLLGTWTATRADGSTFTLTLGDDERFTWVYSRGGRSSTIMGTYTLDQNTLTLDDPQRGAMAGEVALGADNSFTFQMAGLPPGEGALVFRR